MRHRFAPSTVLFLAPMVLLPLAMLTGSVIALRTAVPSAPAVAEAPAAPAPVPRLYVDLPLPVTVSLPDSGHTVNIKIGIAIERGHAMALQNEMALREELLPLLVTRTVLATAETTAPEALRAALPAAVRATFNDELARLALPPAVIEVFINDWTLIR